jgi:hypothetical protein
MKVYLLYKDRDFPWEADLPPTAPMLTRDLDLDTLLGAMAGDDKFLFDVARRVIFRPLLDPEAIRYRQDVLKDCLTNRAVVREIYNLAVDALDRERKRYWGLGGYYPAGRLSGAVASLEIFVDMLKELKLFADTYGHRFVSEGFRTLFAMLRKELDDAFFACVETHLRQLKFRGGVLVSAELGMANKGVNYVLRRPPEWSQGWMERIFAQKPPSYTLHIAPRDEAGAKALGDLRDQGIILVANALVQSTEHVRSFFSMLRTELAFFMGCLNLQERLAQLGEPTSFPEPLALGEHSFACRELYDVCLALALQRKVVGNEVDAEDVQLVMITGANQGGKSTFLRSAGLAQVMLQCGMFAPAEMLRADVCDGLFTHFKREEDVGMKSGKLDEELARMSDIIDAIRPNSVILFNESFAATNEREGSEIARQIVHALLEKNVKILFVTHLYEFAHKMYLEGKESFLFLRADRREDGRRTFKLIEGEPLETSYGEDLYRRIFLSDGGMTGMVDRQGVRHQPAAHPA